MNKGSNRSSRINKALDTSFVKLDDRSLYDLVRFTLDFSKHLTYHNLLNKPDGNWEAFFLNDPVFVIAKIIDTDISTFRFTTDEIINEHNQLQFAGDTSLIRIIQNTLGLSDSVLNWLDFLRNSQYEGALLREIQDIRSSINHSSQDIREWYYLYLQEPTDESVKRFKFRSLEDFDPIHLNQSDIKPELSVEGVYQTFDLIYSKILFFKDKAARKFEEEIFAASDHQPHIGLLLAFFKIYKVVQEDINLQTKKHLDYYFESILGQQQKRNLEVSTTIAIDLEEGIAGLIIDEDEIFVLQSDDNEYTFKTDSRYQLSAAELAEVMTLHKHEFTPYGFEYDNSEFSIVTLHQSDLTTFICDRDEDMLSNDFQAFPYALGESVNYGTEAVYEKRMSDLGLIVSSPSLILEKGEQIVELNFNLFDPSVSGTLAHLEQMKNQELRSLSRNMEETPDEDEVLKKIKTKFFKKAFKVYFTDSVGWREASSMKCNFNADRAELSIRVAIDKLEEELVSYDSELHSGDLTTEWPCIKIVLNHEAQYFAYSFLEKWVIEDITIECSVNGVSSFNLSNSIGDLDSTNPFTPFGPLPIIGSYLKIGNPLILHQHLTELELNMVWGGLPQIRDGFESYYRAYGNKLKNSDFKAVFAKERKVSYNLLEDPVQETTLFDVEDFFLSPKFNIKAVGENLVYDAPIRVIGGEVVNYDKSLFLVLTAPGMAFGHSVFSEIYADAAIKSAKFKRRQVELPKQPYTPVIESLSINYKNLSKENMTRKQADNDSDIKLFHIHPFGISQQFPGPVKSACKFIPEIHNSGNLYMGFVNVNPGDILNIGFDLVSAVSSHSMIGSPGLSLSYLVNNEWVLINQKVLQDSTDSLIQSGVLTVRLPEDIQYHNTILPLDRFWLRISSDVNHDLNSRIKRIELRTITIRLSETMEMDGNEINLAAVNEITAKKNIKGVLNIRGANEFHHILRPENEKTFYGRVSEQLRHKGRAHTNWDMERLILERFDNIDQVRVFGRNSHTKNLIKGSNLQVVLIPKQIYALEDKYNNKKADLATLKKVKRYVEQLVSPFVTVEVSNPIYEALKVRCRVKFSEPERSGYLRDRLNAELVQLINPDSMRGVLNSGFDQGISKTKILNYIESRNYVDQVFKFSVLQMVEVLDYHRLIDTADTRREHEIEVLRTISPYAILTSVRQHHIEVIRTDDMDYSAIAGIGDLAVESDFVITNKKENNDYI